ncbi:MAG: DUF1080 domain-containing protein [Bacteroidales bacterium]|nr:DUF1080 domain-containing protein [Bacteroidales bacterium]MCF8390872.1 DUF1080 domain-containing protein [Bacteroidales bacterium]
MKITNKESIIRVLILIAIMSIVVLISVLTHKKQNREGQPEYDTIVLNKGVNLDNWLATLKDSTANADSTFMMHEGNIFISGEPFGYIKTKDQYSDYQLFVDWRWVDEPGNSGVFLHVGDDQIWPVCLECQLKSGNAGDLVCFPGFDFLEHVDKDKWAVSKQSVTSEKLAGEWNTYDIRVMGDSVSIYVNGVFQNTASKTSKSAGSIALQSEGAPVEFGKVFLVKKRI